MKSKLVAAAAALALTGAGAAAVTAQEAPPTVGVTIAKTKMTVTGAEALKAGPTRLAFTNARRGETGFVVMRLKPGVTRDEVAEAVKRMKDPAQGEKYGTYVASSFLAGPQEYATTVPLAAAEYVIIDITKKPDVRASFVVGGEPSPAVAPQPALTVGLEDYAVDMPGRISRSGTMRVENRGDVLHHLLAFPLRKGVDGKKLLKKIKAGKEPRRAFAGPPSAPVEIVSPGTVNDVEVARRPGKVLYVCFLQDEPKAPPHAALGMAKVVTVE